MKAMIIRQFGDPAIFEMSEVETPQTKPGHVLIRVAASSVNPIDWKLRSGLVPPLTPEFPAVLHGDVAGTVEDVGEGVSHLKAGDEVYACAGGIKGTGGALAEFMLADAELVAHKPPSLSMEEAAALPLVSITAWESLIDRAKIEPGQKVLIHGGAGGVGHVAIQLAKSAGADVFTTISNNTKALLAKELGADYTINHKEQSVEDYVNQYTNGNGFDVVYDTVGEENLANSFHAIKRSGTLVTIAARTTQELSLLHAKGVTFHFVLMLLPMIAGQGKHHHRDILTRLARMVEKKQIKPYLDPDVLDFKDVAKAHKKLEDGQAVGKIALRANF